MINSFKCMALNMLLAVILLQYGSIVIAKTKTPDFPYAKHMTLKLIADRMVVNGVPMRAYQFHTQEDIEEVVAYYQKEWGDDMSNTRFGEWRILSYPHPDQEHLLTVQIENSLNKPTHGILGISPIIGLLDESESKLKKLASNIGKGFPVLPGSKIINDIESNDLGRKGRTIFFQSNRSVKQNYDFYLRKMKSDGWVELIPDLADKSNAAGSALIMNKGAMKLNMSFVETQGKTYGTSVIID